MKKIISIVMVFMFMISSFAFADIYMIMNIKGSFNDLLGFEWIQKELSFLASKGIVKGTSEDTYSPQNGATRADFIALVCRTLGIMDNYAECNFKDVNKTKWYYTAISSAAKNKIIESSSENFEPEKQITRLEIMTILGKALNENIGLEIPKNYNEVLDKYSDNGLVSGSCRPYVALTVNSGLVIPKNSRVINPNATVTRAEMIGIITGLYNLL